MSSKEISKKLSRRQFLEIIATSLAALMTENEARAEVPERLPPGPADERSLMGLFSRFIEPIMAAIKEASADPNQYCPLLTFLAFVLTGNQPNFVSQDNHSDERIGLLRIHLLNAKGADLTDPFFSAKIALNFLKKSLAVRKDDIREALFDYMEGPYRRGATDETRYKAELVIEGANLIRKGINGQEERKYFENFLKRLYRVDQLRETIERGMRYLLLGPGLPLEKESILGIIKNFGQSTAYQPEGHTGWDFVAPPNSPVLAVADGKVVYAGWINGTPGTNTGMGYTIVIEHAVGNGLPPLYTVYAHCAQEKEVVKVGQTVKRGEIIGYIGDKNLPRGASSGPHLHFSVLEGAGVVPYLMEKGKLPRLKDKIPEINWVHPLAALPQRMGYPGSLKPSSPVYTSGKEEKEEGIKTKIDEQIGENEKRVLKKLGLLDKMVVVVYGRPEGHGSLGSARDAKTSWAVAERILGVILPAARVSLKKEEAAVLGVNPVDQIKLRTGGYSNKLSIDYILELLKEGKTGKELVLLDLGLTGIAGAKQRVEEIEGEAKKKFGEEGAKKLLSRLSITLDLEHMPSDRLSADINDFSRWFNDKRETWLGGGASLEAPILPGMVAVYAFLPEDIKKLGGLNQYYDNIVVPVIFDGWGNKEAKFAGLKNLVQTLKNDKNQTPLVGVMESTIKWGNKYDKCSLVEILKMLEGSPVFFIFVQ